MKKVFALMMAVCLMFGVVTEYSYAAEQQSNIRYVTENEFGDVKFSQVAAGYNHSLGLSEDGTVYSWGNNARGQLGDGTREDKSTPLPIMDDIRFISASYNNSFAITTEDELYTWGMNMYGELGNGTTNDQVRPIKVMDDVQTVDAGLYYTLILTNNGDLYGVGRDHNGVLGQGNGDTKVLDPVKILDDVQKVKIAADNFHSLVLTTDGVLYQFGLLSNDLVQYEPTIVMENVKDIECGYNTAFAITNDHELYGWGDGTTSGALMSTASAEDTIKPMKLYDNALMVSASAQVLVLDMDNNLITWGSNTNGQLGDGTTENSITPNKVMENISSVDAHLSHSLAISEDGELYAWGLNDNGRLGNGLTSGNILVPTKIQILKDERVPRIEFDSPDLRLPLNTTTAIKATVYNSTSTEATWSSSDPSIATVTDTGEVTTVGVGVTEITMTTEDGITNICTVTVTEEDIPTPDTPLLSLLLEVGEGAQLSVSHELGDNLDFTWSSTDTDIVGVDSNGYITAKAEGIARIYAENDTNNFYVDIKVIANGTSDEYRLAIDLRVEQTARLYLSDSENITWSSMDASTATIDNTGKVTAVSEGLAIMQAELDGNTYIIYVRVR